jgi:hypothetical protein
MGISISNPNVFIEILGSTDTVNKFQVGYLVDLTYTTNINNSISNYNFNGLIELSNFSLGYSFIQLINYPPTNILDGTTINFNDGRVISLNITISPQSSTQPANGNFNFIATQ